MPGKFLRATENVIVVIFVESFPARNLGRLPDKSGIVKPNIKKANLQPIIADQVDQLVGLGRDRLLV